MSGVIDSKQDSLEIQRAVQNFIKEESKLDMKEWKGPILSTKFEMAKYLGTLVTCYNTRNVMETLTSHQNNWTLINKTCMINFFIKDLTTKALEHQCAKQNAKRSAQTTSNQQLVAQEDKNIVISFSLIIHDIVKYYLFVKKCFSLWKVMSI